MSKASINTKEKLQAARDLETEGNLAGAIDLYLQVVGSDPLNTPAYSRLMVIYRRQKEYKKELAIINKAIKSHEESVRSNVQAWTNANRKAARLSKALAGSLGLIGRNGLPLHEDPLLEAWRKRKVTVTKKLAK